MAQTKRKRTRKHRGTQAGTVEARRASGGRPRTRADAREVARERRAQRGDTPPTWRGALNRAIVSSAVFGVFVVLVLGWTVTQALPLALVMTLVYLPLSFYTDRLIYNRRQRRR
ncbi:MAG TPA: hypothetical protein VF520_16815 [Thermoleophilaceae bacterium]|jgi:Flp pilus assembly protein TadB